MSEKFTKRVTGAIRFSLLSVTGIVALCDTNPVFADLCTCHCGERKIGKYSGVEGCKVACLQQGYCGNGKETNCVCQ